MTPRAPHPVTPLVAMIFGREGVYAPALLELEKIFGPRELESPVFAFDKTSYYEPEFGPNLKRRFVTFARLADPALLAEWKQATNALEERLARAMGSTAAASTETRSTLLPPAGGENEPGAASHEPSFKRCINLDAGYITAAKFVLASTKDFAHRIYLRDGIFAEITLRFRDGQWLAHEFTFPDFKAPDYHAFLRQARDAHMRKDSGAWSVERRA